MTTKAKFTFASLSGSILIFTSCSHSRLPLTTFAQAPDTTISATKVLPDSSPALLTKKELEVLLRRKDDDTPESRKMKLLFNTPFVDNSAYRKKGLPSRSLDPVLGESLRVSSWNIEKSIHADKVSKILKSEKAFKANLKPEVLKNKKRYAEALRQRNKLASSDILLLQEMDLGHCRSGYAFVAKDMARQLGMNFVYAPQQLEIDPSYLGVKDIKFSNPPIPGHTCDSNPENASHYKGVFGVAVLSRYPIKSVQIFPLVTQPHDWYAGEIGAPDLLEKSRRFGAKALFHSKTGREVKAGGRGFTRVDLHVPGVPHDTITVINIHLEIKTQPKYRTEQMREILSYIGDIKNPVIMAGDHNSSAVDVSSTSFARAAKRNVTSPSRLTSIGLFLANTTGISQTRSLFNGLKNFQDPLAWGIPVLFPNKTKQMFELIEDFRFEDGGAFDFRGNKIRSKSGSFRTLSNANHRNSLKGFVQTFTTPQNIGPFGCERLDWMFVKSHLKDSNNNKGSYKLAPHFGETFSLLNRTALSPYSDHQPISTIIPFNEPDVKTLKKAYKNR